jgi:hypothetical protein
MATNNAEGINFKIVSTGNHQFDNRRPTKLVHLTLEKVLRFIDAKQLDVHVAALLKKTVNAYPENALENWVNNFSIHLSNARKKVQAMNLPPSVADLESESLVSNEEHLSPISAPPVNPEFD